MPPCLFKQAAFTLPENIDFVENPFYFFVFLSTKKFPFSDISIELFRVSTKREPIILTDVIKFQYIRFRSNHRKY